MSSSSSDGHDQSVTGAGSGSAVPPLPPTHSSSIKSPTPPRQHGARERISSPPPVYLSRSATLPSSSSSSSSQRDRWSTVSSSSSTGSGSSGEDNRRQSMDQSRSSFEVRASIDGSHLHQVVNALTVNAEKANRRSTVTPLPSGTWPKVRDLVRTLEKKKQRETVEPVVSPPRKSQTLKTMSSHITPTNTPPRSPITSPPPTIKPAAKPVARPASYVLPIISPTPSLSSSLSTLTTFTSSASASGSGSSTTVAMNNRSTSTPIATYSSNFPSSSALSIGSTSPSVSVAEISKRLSLLQEQAPTPPISPSPVKSADRRPISGVFAAIPYEAPTSAEMKPLPKISKVPKGILDTFEQPAPPAPPAKSYHSSRITSLESKSASSVSETLLPPSQMPLPPPLEMSRAIKPMIPLPPPQPISTAASRTPSPPPPPPPPKDEPTVEQREEKSKTQPVATPSPRRMSLPDVSHVEEESADSNRTIRSQTSVPDLGAQAHLNDSRSTQPAQRGALFTLLTSSQPSFLRAKRRFSSTSDDQSRSDSPTPSTVDTIVSDSNNDGLVSSPTDGIPPFKEFPTSSSSVAPILPRHRRDSQNSSMRRPSSRNLQSRLSMANSDADTLYYPGASGSQVGNEGDADSMSMYGYNYNGSNPSWSRPESRVSTRGVVGYPIGEEDDEEDENIMDEDDSGEVVSIADLERIHRGETPLCGEEDIEEEQEHQIYENDNEGFMVTELDDEDLEVVTLDRLHGSEFVDESSVSKDESSHVVDDEQQHLLVPPASESTRRRSSSGHTDGDFDVVEDDCVVTLAELDAGLTEIMRERGQTPIGDRSELINDQYSDDENHRYAEEHQIVDEQMDIEIEVSSATCVMGREEYDELVERVVEWEVNVPLTVVHFGEDEGPFDDVKREVVEPFIARSVGSVSVSRDGSDEGSVSNADAVVDGEGEEGEHVDDGVVEAAVSVSEEEVKLADLVVGGEEMVVSQSDDREAQVEAIVDQHDDSVSTDSRQVPIVEEFITTNKSDADAQWASFEIKTESTVEEQDTTATKVTLPDPDAQWAAFELKSESDISKQAPAGPQSTAFDADAAWASFNMKKGDPIKEFVPSSTDSSPSVENSRWAAFNVKKGVPIKEFVPSSTAAAPLDEDARWAAFEISNQVSSAEHTGLSDEDAKWHAYTVTNDDWTIEHPAPTDLELDDEEHLATVDFWAKPELVQPVATVDFWAKPEIAVDVDEPVATVDFWAKPEIQIEVEVDEPVATVDFWAYQTPVVASSLVSHVEVEEAVVNQVHVPLSVENVVERTAVCETGVTLSVSMQGKDVDSVTETHLSLSTETVLEIVDVEQVVPVPLMVTKMDIEVFADVEVSVPLTVMRVELQNMVAREVGVPLSWTSIISHEAFYEKDIKSDGWTTAIASILPPIEKPEPATTTPPPQPSPPKSLSESHVQSNRDSDKRWSTQSLSSALLPADIVTLEDDYSVASRITDAMRSSVFEPPVEEEDTTTEESDVEVDVGGEEMEIVGDRGLSEVVDSVQEKMAGEIAVPEEFRSQSTDSETGIPDVAETTEHTETVTTEPLPVGTEGDVEASLENVEQVDETDATLETATSSLSAINQPSTVQQLEEAIVETENVDLSMEVVDITTTSENADTGVVDEATSGQPVDLTTTSATTDAGVALEAITTVSVESVDIATLTETADVVHEGATAVESAEPVDIITASENEAPSVESVERVDVTTTSSTDPSVVISAEEGEPVDITTAMETADVVHEAPTSVESVEPVEFITTLESTDASAVTAAESVEPVDIATTSEDVPSTMESVEGVKEVILESQIVPESEVLPALNQSVQITSSTLSSILSPMSIINLESVSFVDNATSFTVSVDLAVANLHFEKNVFAVYTIDNWTTPLKSTSDDVTYMDHATGANRHPAGVDRFRVAFRFNVENLNMPVALQFAICCVMNGAEYWENRGGLNHVVELGMAPVAVEADEVVTDSVKEPVSVDQSDVLVDESMISMEKEVATVSRADSEETLEVDFIELDDSQEQTVNQEDPIGNEVEPVDVQLAEEVVATDKEFLTTIVSSIVDSALEQATVLEDRNESTDDLFTPVVTISEVPTHSVDDTLPEPSEAEFVQEIVSSLVDSALEHIDMVQECPSVDDASVLSVEIVEKTEIDIVADANVVGEVSAEDSGNVEARIEEVDMQLIVEDATVDTSSALSVTEGELNETALDATIVVDEVVYGKTLESAGSESLSTAHTTVATTEGQVSSIMEAVLMADSTKDFEEQVRHLEIEDTAFTYEKGSPPSRESFEPLPHLLIPSVTSFKHVDDREASPSSPTRVLPSTAVPDSGYESPEAHVVRSEPRQLHSPVPSRHLVDSASIKFLSDFGQEPQLDTDTASPSNDTPERENIFHIEDDEEELDGDPENLRMQIQMNSWSLSNPINRSPKRGVALVRIPSMESIAEEDEHRDMDFGNVGTFSPRSRSARASFSLDSLKEDELHSVETPAEEIAEKITSPWIPVSQDNVIEKQSLLIRGSEVLRDTSMVVFVLFVLYQGGSTAAGPIVEFFEEFDPMWLGHFFLTGAVVLLVLENCKRRMV
ncbi:hypothetical protein HDU76_011830 [Blyttiomyces sp. JEL0837]|nr:hypothetical protein HDU76_011830 [Blyttiomyces sp. JEL0837]